MVKGAKSQLFSWESILRILKEIVRVCYTTTYLLHILIFLRVHYFLSVLNRRQIIIFRTEIVSPRGINWSVMGVLVKKMCAFDTGIVNLENFAAI